MNRGPIDRPSSTWFAALVALLVALGAQVLLGSVVPANFAEWSLGPTNGRTTLDRVTADTLWLSGSIIRLLSFATGGVVAVLLLGCLTARLLGMLIVVAVLATVFEQFPTKESLVLLALWSLAAPAGVSMGAWVGSAKRGVA